MSNIETSTIPRITGNDVSGQQINAIVRSLQLIFSNIEVGQPPQMTTTTRDELSFDEGYVIFNLTTKKHQGWDGTSWNDFYA